VDPCWAVVGGPVLEVGSSEGTAWKALGWAYMWLYKGAAAESGGCGTIVPDGLHTIVDTTVPKGWQAIVAPLDKFIFLPWSSYWDVKQNYQ
jgi:hypothetical protein